MITWQQWLEVNRRKSYDQPDMTAQDLSAAIKNFLGDRRIKTMPTEDNPSSWAAGRMTGEQGSVIIASELSPNRLEVKIFNDGYTGNSYTVSLVQGNTAKRLLSGSDQNHAVFFRDLRDCVAEYLMGQDQGA